MFCVEPVDPTHIPLFVGAPAELLAKSYRYPLFTAALPIPGSVPTSQGDDVTAAGDATPAAAVR